MILDRSYSEKFAKSGDLQSPDHKNTYEFVVAILTILSSSTSSFVHIYILDNKASAHYRCSQIVIEFQHISAPIPENILGRNNIKLTKNSHNSIIYPKVK